MKRTVMLVIVAMLAGVGSLQAQMGMGAGKGGANTISETMKGSWMNISDLLAKMADKMPEENYRYKETPEVQDFGVRMAHAISFMMRGCAAVKGDGKTLTFTAAPTKPEVLTGMKDARAECDAVFGSLTDADLGKMIAGGRGGPRPAYAILSGTVLEHSQEMYGYMAVYLRGKGIVPPSSDRNEK